MAGEGGWLTLQQAVVGDDDEGVHRGAQVGECLARLALALAPLKREGHGDNADVRVNGAERVVGRFRFARAGDGVEQG